MVVAPVDVLAVTAPTWWDSDHRRALLVLAAVWLVLLAEPGRHRARLHLTVLDDLPALAGRLLIAVALVAFLHVVRHHGVDAIGYLSSAAWSVALVVAGRSLTTSLLLAARRRRVVAHRTVLVGTGPLARDLLLVLGRLPRYGLHVVGAVDDPPVAADSLPVPHLGGVRDLESVVTAHRVEVLLVVDGSFDDRDVLDRVQSVGCLPCDLLVVPRLHAFRSVGADDHIGTIPVVQLRRRPRARRPRPANV